MSEIILSTLSIGARIGKGGFGSIFEVGGYVGSDAQGPFVFKRYSDDALSRYSGGLRATLDGLINTRLQMSDRERKQLDARTTWPLDVVLDNGDPVGFVMKRLQDKYFFDLPKFMGGFDRRPRELQHYFASEQESAAKGLVPMSIESRAYLFARFTQQIDFLHSKDIIIGDIQGSNVVVDVDPSDPSRTALNIYDLDSCRKVGERPAIPQANAFAWEAPETLAHQAAARNSAEGSREQMVHRSKAAALTKSTDVFKCALLAVRLFALENGVSVARDSTSARRMLKRTFGEGANVIIQGLNEDPKSRPTSSELFKACVGK